MLCRERSGLCLDHSRAISPCAASKRSLCGWSVNAPTPAAWRPGYPRILPSSGFTFRPILSTRTPRPSADCFPQELYGAIVSFELREAGREDIFRFMDALKMIVRATSLGDVHSMMLYPVMSSHREISPKHRERMGIRDNLLRLSVGIEAVEDIMEDLDQALVL